MRYYFDTLPVHPQPKPLESFTSYLIRLAEANHISWSRSLLSLFWDSPQFIARPADYPPTSLGRLPLVASSNEAKLWSTTFYHLAKKFHCSIDPRAVAKFLLGSLSQFLRYCPRCVGNYGYYPLIWRFLCLPGCPRHGCRLLESCSHCGQPLPLFAAPLKIGICSKCKGDLRTCISELLPHHEWSIALARSKDLAFLLTPHPWERSDTSLLAALGQQFGFRRKSQHLRQIDVDVRVGFREGTTKAIDHGAVQGNSSLPCVHLPFQRYLAYANLLNVPLSELFTAALAQIAAEEESSISDQQSRAQPYFEQAGEHQAKQSSQSTKSLESIRQSINQHNTREEITLSPEGLGSYGDPSSEQQSIHLSDGWESWQYNWREQLLLKRVRIAYEQLKSRGESVTMKAISRSIGRAPCTLRRYPQVRAFLATVIKKGGEQTQQRKAQPREAMLVPQVQAAIDQLKAQGQSITQEAIAESLHRTLRYLRSLPSVRALLDQATGVDQATRALLREEELLQQFKEAIHLLESRGQGVTLQALQEFFDLSVRNLVSYYPRIKALWQQELNSRARQQELQFEQREEQLLEQVKGIIKRLELEEQPITAITISRLMGRSIGGWKHYPRIAALLESIVEANRARKAVG